jgi:hypothetical protein
VPAILRVLHDKLTVAIYVVACYICVITYPIGRIG